MGVLGADPAQIKPEGEVEVEPASSWGERLTFVFCSDCPWYPLSCISGSRDGGNIFLPAQQRHRRFPSVLVAGPCQSYE